MILLCGIHPEGRIMDIDRLLSDLIEEKNNRYRKGIYGYTQRTLAYNSNKIEGSTLTEDQTAALFEEGVIAASEDYYRAKDIEEMNGHFLMFNHMLNTMDEPLSEELIKSFHYELKSGVFEVRSNGYAIGDYKKKANMVGSNKTCSPADVPIKMNELLAWYHANTVTLETIAGFHLRYESLHPFQDGNGRTGRLIVYRECIKNGMTPLVIEDKNRKQYMEAFAAYRNDGNTDPMLELFKKEQEAYMEECRYFYD